MHSATLREPAVQLIDLGVRFRLPRDRIYSFKEYVLRRLMRPQEYIEFRALEAVDLEVEPGEALGIIGSNGAGKSTLLKVIARVLPPTSGRVVVRGKVAPLLELGAGFHPDMTGLENVFINSTILGYPQALVRERLNDVIGFAELQDFMNMPIRTYSSGMQARLGFSVATMFRPDVLLLDEILTVGDLGFQKKCLDRIKGFQRDGTSVVFVSHSLEMVAEHCSRAVWIEKGRIAAEGMARDVTERYVESLGGNHANPVE